MGTKDRMGSQQRRVGGKQATNNGKERCGNQSSWLCFMPCKQIRLYHGEWQQDWERKRREWKSFWQQLFLSPPHSKHHAPVAEHELSARQVKDIKKEVNRYYMTPWLRMNTLDLVDVPNTAVTSSLYSERTFYITHLQGKRWKIRQKSYFIVVVVFSTSNLKLIIGCSK